MRSSLKWVVPSVVVFGFVMGVSALTARGAEAEKGKINGTVVDKDGKAVAGAKVDLVKPQQRGQAQQGQRQRPEPLATATTDKDGKFELKLDKAKVEDGRYRVTTNVQGKGRASATVTVKDGAVEKAVELKLAERQGRGNRGGGAGGAGQ